MAVVFAHQWPGNDRLGGWGPAWLFLLLPGWFAGIGFLFYKRRWLEAILGVILLILLAKYPGSWWARFSLSFFGFAVVYTAVVLSAIPKATIQKTLAVILVITSALAGAEAWYIFRRDSMPDDLAPAPGEFLHSLDTVRSDNIFLSRPDDLDVYHWCRDNLPADSVLVYFHEEFLGFYHYWFYRHDLKNKVHGIGEPKSEEDFLQSLRDRNATHFMVENLEARNTTIPEDKVSAWEIAPQHGELVFETESYRIYKVK